MKCLILAAGYATRLYPLTENFPKPLLDVNGKTILDWLIEDIQNIHDINEIIIISNDKFKSIFESWSNKLHYSVPITIINDGSTNNDNRLGAVKDIAFAIKEKKIDEDIMVLAGDNLLDFSLKGFYDFYKEKNTTCIMRHYEESIEKLKRTGVVQLDGDKVIEMQEKPQLPKSNWAVPPFYIYCKDDLIKIVNGVDNAVCNTDAPGSFIAWFCKKSDVHAYCMPGKRYDIGNLESYKYIKSNYKGLLEN